jgi:hypothetical protein
VTRVEDDVGADENHDEARRLLGQAGVLRHGSDLDLLVFFARHPRALLTSEQIATFLGYEINQIAESLELLLDARLVTRTQNPSHAARLYVLASGHESGGWLPGLLELAASRKGRLALLTALTERRTRGPAEPVARSANVRTLRSVRG